jgi:mRNA-degrading endonuclease RelE of RelBE toxin-antitoxin system
MFSLIFTEQFDKSFCKIKDKKLQKQIWNKICELEKRAPLGKKLKNNPYWSIHVNKYRIIYEIKDNKLTIADLLQRKQDYREV